MNSKIDISPLKRFFNLLRVEKQDIFSIYVYAVFNGIVVLSLPLGIQAIINLIGGGQISTSWIVLVAFVIIGVGFTGIMQIMQLTISENIQQKIFARSAFEFAYRIPRLKFEAVDKLYTPELVNRFFDTLSVQKGLSKILIDFSSASLQVVFGLILLSLYHPFFVLFSFVLVGSAYLIFHFTSPRGLRTSIIESNKKYEVAHWLEELARTMETFKLAGKSQLPLRKTDETVTDYLTSRKKHFKTLQLQYINLVVFKVFVTAGLLIIGGLLVLNQEMNIGQFVAAEIIIILVMASVEKLVLSMETIYDVLTAIEKIGFVTDIPLERDTGSEINIDRSKGVSISLKNITHRFDESEVDILKNINLDIAAGEKVCLSGYNGSGKSVLLQIMAGLYDHFSGSLSYNGIPLGNWKKENIRSLIGDSLAKEGIFKGSLFENISLGKPDISAEEVMEIAEVLGLSEFVESLPEGYDTQMISEGKNLPKSIRLKIMLARSLTGNPAIIMLDDNFNHLGKKDRTRFLDYIISKPWTVVVVSNNPDVAMQLDKIVVMERGEILAVDRAARLNEKSWFENIYQN